jgi:hypothetical protein
MHAPADLLLRFTEAVDQRRADLAANCFLADGVFRPGDKTIDGRAEILRFYEARLADPLRRTRHAWANITATEEAAGVVRLTALLTNYALEPSVSLDAVQMRIGNVSCRVERDSDGEWRFAEHFYERAFALSLPAIAA